jgi:serine protease Do
MTAHPAAFLRKLWLPLAMMGLLLCANVGVRAEQPAALGKPTPESIEDLKAIQKQLQKVLEKVVPATVGVQVGNAAGSGVIVNAEGYVLTAGHVSGKPDQECFLIFPDGKRVKGKTLGQNVGIDSGMIKITEEGKWPFIEMGASAKLGKGTWCVSVGHPGGYIKGRSPVVRLGRIMELDNTVIRSDCTLVGGDSGGPLFDMDGKLIGIHSRIGRTTADNYHVPVDTYKDTWDRLAKGESWGGFDLFGGPQPYVGLRLDLEAKECKVTRVTEGSPAEKAGLKVGDIVVKFGTDKPSGPEELLKWLRGKKVGDEVALEVQRDKEVLALKLVIGKQR